VRTASLWNNSIGYMFRSSISQGSRESCIRRFLVQSVFFRTLFDISSGPGALSGASRFTASRICRIVILASYEISCGYTADGMSVRFAGGGFPTKISFTYLCCKSLYLDITETFVEQAFLAASNKIIGPRPLLVGIDLNPPVLQRSIIRAT
jgi:hypothetical protein